MKNGLTNMQARAMTNDRAGCGGEMTRSIETTISASPWAGRMHCGRTFLGRVEQSHKANGSRTCRRGSLSQAYLFVSGQPFYYQIVDG